MERTVGISSPQKETYVLIVQLLQQDEYAEVPDDESGEELVFASESNAVGITTVDRRLLCARKPHTQVPPHGALDRREDRLDLRTVSVDVVEGHALGEAVRLIEEIPGAFRPV